MRKNLILWFATLALCIGNTLGQSNRQTTPVADVTANANTSQAQEMSTSGAAPGNTPNEVREDFRESMKDVHFDLNRAALTGDDRAVLNTDAQWLKAHPQVFVTIEGDADERGSIAYNLFLSDLRAKVTRDGLVEMGVPENQILFAQGWGKLYPVCTQEEESCWSQNRRSHLAAWPPQDINSRASSQAAVQTSRNEIRLDAIKPQ